MATNAKVYIVDDDDDMRNSIQWLLESANLPVCAFESAEQFLASYNENRPGCLLLDVRMPGMGGLRLLEYLQSIHRHLPVIMFTGYGDVDTAVRTLKAGAFDFLEKTANHQLILERVRLALAEGETLHLRELDRTRCKQLLTKLSPREHEVMLRLIQGQANKVIAVELGLSERTVEKHRKNIMEKTNVGSIAELTRLFYAHDSEVV
ncbi:MAG: response regulator [Proteobacteria bacterium]|nr:response regulator [Pseudomonadota bacterium]